MCFSVANGVSLSFYNARSENSMNSSVFSRVDPLDIGLVQPVQTNRAGVTDGFDKLVLPPGHKDIVRALVRTHTHRVEGSEAKAAIKLQREFDIVKGKGKGLIILLHGAPGMHKAPQQYTRSCVNTNSSNSKG